MLFRDSALGIPEKCAKNLLNGIFNDIVVKRMKKGKGVFRSLVWKMSGIEGAFMSDHGTWEVAGFSFRSEEDAEAARQDVQKIEYLEKHINYNMPENMLAVYHKVLENKLVRTPVGWDYLRNMQLQMIAAGVQADQIPPIPLNSTFIYQAYHQNKEHGVKQRIKSELKKEKTEGEKYRARFQRTLIACVGLLVLVATMFYITLRSENPNMLNYRNAILNQYSSWEQELTERERVIREKEKKEEIGGQPENQNG